MAFENIYVNDINCSKSLVDLFKNDFWKCYSLDLNDPVFRFLNVNYDNNRRCIYFKNCNKASQQAIFFIQTIIGIFLNNFDMICEFLIDHNFDAHS